MPEVSTEATKPTTQASAPAATPAPAPTPAPMTTDTVRDPSATPLTPPNANVPQPAPTQDVNPDAAPNLNAGIPPAVPGEDGLPDELPTASETGDSSVSEAVSAQDLVKKAEAAKADADKAISEAKAYEVSVANETQAAMIAAENAERSKFGAVTEKVSYPTAHGRLASDDEMDVGRRRVEMNKEAALRRAAPLPLPEVVTDQERALPESVLQEQAAGREAGKHLRRGRATGPTRKSS